jgi:plasmid stabilization system protein ParE
MASTFMGDTIDDSGPKPARDARRRAASASAELGETPLGMPRAARRGNPRAVRIGLQ